MYYTGRRLARHVVESTLGPLLDGLEQDEILGLKVLDPAAGTGRFLTEAAVFLAERSGCDLGMVAERCLFGVDTDPLALEIARLSLRALGARASPNLVCADFLGSPPPFEGAQFDAVIGNPPYLSFSGRQKAAGYEGRRGLGGWRTSHGLFVVSAMDRLGPGGMLSMVVPDQLGHLAGYGPTRARLLAEGALVEARYWGDDVFPGVASPILTFVVRREDGSPAREAEITLRDGRKVRANPRGEDVWHVSPAAGLLKRMLERHPTIAGFGDPGVHTGNMAARLILTEPRPGAVPVLEGRRIQPYRCSPPAKWLDLTCQPRDNEYRRIGSPETYRGVAIVLRQTANRPIAARHRFGCHFRNSVLALRPPEGYSVEYLLAVLNSEAACELYRALSAESAQGDFPQVKVGVLRRLPIPDPAQAPGIVAEIERLVPVLEGNPERTETRSRVEDLVAELYGMSRQSGQV